MKDFKLTLTALLVGIFSISLVTLTLAQDPATNAEIPPVAADALSAPAEEVTPIEEEEGLMYTYGTVVSVAADSIVINEYDFDSDSFKEITYAVDPQVKLANVAALTDVKAGDSVEIYYVVDGDKKITKTIGKDEEELLEEDVEMEEAPQATLPEGTNPPAEAPQGR